MPASVLYCTVLYIVHPSSISSAHLLMVVTQFTFHSRRTKLRDTLIGTKLRDTLCQEVRMLPRDEDNIVCTWLRFLHVEEYSSNFLDNGYDDLETVKQMREEDLRAIGISRGEDEELLLLSVKILRERGAAWVYFLSADSDAGIARIK